DPYGTTGGRGRHGRHRVAALHTRNASAAEAQHPGRTYPEDDGGVPGLRDGPCAGRGGLPGAGSEDRAVGVRLPELPAGRQLRGPHIASFIIGDTHLPDPAAYATTGIPAVTKTQNPRSCGDPR